MLPQSMGVWIRKGRKATGAGTGAKVGAGAGAVDSKEVESEEDDAVTEF